MTEAERLIALMKDLLSNPGYAGGRRSFPRTLEARDAIAITAAVHGELEHWGRERQGVARSRKLTIACEPGCCHCCEQPVTVYLPEALRIVEWLRRPEHRTAREAFLAAYPAWRERAGEGHDALTRAIAAGDVRAEEEAHLAQWQRRAMCAFNAGGLCTIYEVRPAACRACHALETPERCRADRWSGRREDLPSALSFVPLDDAVGRGKL